MVGTIEPRKGHDQALAAFSALWDEGVEANLVIVGQAGWGRDAFLHSMRTHPAWGRQLLWFNDASDEELLRLYRLTDGCLMASRGEGFGLPLIEAARYDLPVLARDLSVFEEVAGDNVTYFSGESAESLASSLKTWFVSIEAGTAPRSGGIRWLTWEQSTQEFTKALRRHVSD
jgi:glycosyltransferase involved in cell wall biosynthesis